MVTEVLLCCGDRSSYVVVTGFLCCGDRSSYAVVTGVLMLW